MAKISNQSSYPSISPADSDYIIGTDSSDDNATKTFDFSGIFTYINTKLTDSSITPVYASEKVVQSVRFAEAVSKGDPVYISGYNAGQNRPEVSKADASDAAQMPSIGLAAADYAINTNGTVISVGDLTDVDTDALGDEGDIVYVASVGGLTVTKTTDSNLIQNVGKISRSNQNNGSIEVFSVGRTNDVPNLSEGKICVGSDANTIESSFVTLNESATTLSVGGDVDITASLSAAVIETSNGIYLGGTDSSNLLNDYEEGTFTPDVGAYIGGTLTPVYNTQEGFYTKIGDVCFAKIRIVLDETSAFGGSGILMFGGLPFPIEGNTNTSSVSCSISDIIRVDSLESFVGARYGVINTTVSLQIISSPTGDGQTIGVTTGDLQTGGDITIDFTLTYRTT